MRVRLLVVVVVGNSVEGAVAVVALALLDDAIAVNHSPDWSSLSSSLVLSRSFLRLLLFLLLLRFGQPRQQRRQPPPQPPQPRRKNFSSVCGLGAKQNRCGILRTSCHDVTDVMSAHMIHPT